MKSSGLSIFVAIVVAALFTDCGGVQHYDGRLVAADSLMWSAPDSALAVVGALDTLDSEGDLAYRDMLMTQARYKCYAEITAADDSSITRAMGYFSTRSGDREKLTRSLFYKGAVMEELGYIDSAMYYYRSAEATADPKDYSNLGQINTRIADLYREEYSQDSTAIIRFKESIRYFSILADTNYIIYGLGAIGCIYGVIQPDSAQHYLANAIRLAQQFDPSLQYSHKSTLAGLYYYQNNYVEAKNTSMDILRNGKDDCSETQFYYYAALSYLKLGNLDSAKYILNITPQPVDAVDSMNYYNVLAEIANLENNHDLYKKYKELSHEITEQIISDSKKGRIAVAESEFEKVHSQIHFEVKMKEYIKITAAILLLLLVIFTIVYYSARRQLIKRLDENKAIKHELEKALVDLNEQAQRNKSVSELVAYRTAALRELYQDIRVRIKDDNRVKKVIPLASVFQGMRERNEILELNLKEKFWENMKRSVDGEFNGIYSFVEHNFPNLTERDLKIFCLLCADLSPQLIRLCMNLTSARTITNYRSVIVKKKMGLDMSLDTFIKKYLNGDFSLGDDKRYSP
ncbi:MAG: hypothetical protein IKH25_03820 [Muribaculaceae bacterium]|nr:hypothetical protein [Muribaculaceae bacterium]